MIYKGSYENDKQNGLGLLWLPDGTLYQGNFKDNQREGLQLIYYETTKDTAEAEYRDDEAEGLYALHEPDNSLIWLTFSRDQEHGLKILKNNVIVLKEAGNGVKAFNEEEAKLIREGKKDVTYLTQFFKNKEESEQRLNYALGGRPIYLEKEMREMVERGKKLRESIRAFREKHNI